MRPSNTLIPATTFGTNRWYIQQPPIYLGSGFVSVVYQVSSDAKGTDYNYGMQIRSVADSDNFKQIYAAYEKHGLVVPILDEWKTGNDAVIKVFPKLDATVRDLTQWDLSVEDWINIGEAIVRMVNGLHTDVGYIHHDSTPNNIMVKKVKNMDQDGIYVNLTKGLYRLYFIDVDDSIPFDGESKVDDKFILGVYDALSDFEALADFVAKIKPEWNELEIFSYIVGCIRKTSKEYNIDIDNVYNIVKTQFGERK